MGLESPKPGRALTNDFENINYESATKLRGATRADVRSCDHLLYLLCNLRNHKGLVVNRVHTRLHHLPPPAFLIRSP